MTSDSLPDLFLECGWPARVNALIGFALLCTTVAGFAVSRSQRGSPHESLFVIALLSLATLPALLGVAGYFEVFRTFANTTGAFDGPADAATIQLALRGEAQSCVILGLWWSVAPALGGSVLLGLALMRGASRPPVERS